MPAIDRRIPTPAGGVRIVSTDRSDGDFAVALAGDDLDRRRRTIVDAPWTWLRQRHGSAVVVVDQPGAGAGSEVDAAVTSCRGAPVAVTTADCAPVVLVSTESVAVVHAGWRGLASGVVAQAALAVARLGGEPVETVLGPCIGPEHYAFGVDDLAVLVEQFGPTVAANTADGEPALDVPEAVTIACEAAGWPAPHRPPSTSDGHYFSHRVRGDVGRQTTVAWLDG